jgi:hypothetical protein
MTTEIEPLVTDPKGASVALHEGLTAVWKMIETSELESYVVSNRRKITMASIKGRIARKLAEATTKIRPTPGFKRGERRANRAETVAA